MPLNESLGQVSDVLANGAGLSCGTLLGLPFRTLIALL
jgi:hypothetical protein